MTRKRLNTRLTIMMLKRHRGPTIGPPPPMWSHHYIVGIQVAPIEASVMSSTAGDDVMERLGLQGHLRANTAPHSLT